MSNNYLPFLADRVLNRPLLIHPDKAATILNVLQGRIGHGPFEFDANAFDANRFVGTDRTPRTGVKKLFRQEGQTAIVTIDGSLVNRGAWIGAQSGLTSYEGIAAQLDDEAKDAKAGKVKALIIDMDSYGGEATGMCALAQKIRELRKSIRVVAVVNDVAASAGYGIVSAADEIVISPTSLVGSIGVVVMHVDHSEEMAKQGLAVSFVHAGAKKVDGHPFGPLSEGVRADMQKDVMTFYDRFLETVELGREVNRLNAKSAKETEAGVFIGQDAITAGLADRIGSLESVLADLDRMAKAGGLKSITGQPAQRAAANSDVAEVSGTMNQSERMAAILTSPEGKARPRAALALATASTDVSSETVISVLAAIPEEGQPKARIKSEWDLAYRASQMGEVGPIAPALSQTEKVQSGWSKAIASHNSHIKGGQEKTEPTNAPQSIAKAGWGNILAEHNRQFLEGEEKAEAVNQAEQSVSEFNPHPRAGGGRMAEGKRRIQSLNYGKYC